MATIPAHRLEQVIDRFEEVEARMGAVSDPDEIVALSKEHAELRPVAEKAKELAQARADYEEAETMMEGDDPDMAELAREEYYALKESIPDLENEVQILLLPKDQDDDANAVLEVRAGTGGDEAALFAGDLFRMYQRYAQLQGWKMNVISASEGDAGGYKEIIAEIEGDGVFGKLKFESGVHRVQRVPKTESGGRIHTSAATVAVLPAPENVEIEVKQEDIRIDTMRASGAGGQHVNTTDSAVRITHLPTGIVVTSSEKSQHANRAKAMEVLKVRLYEKEREEKDAARSEARKSQVGSGDRSEKIRTYNFPENRVSDHRIKLTLHKMDTVLAGDDLGDVINALLAEDQAAKLADMEAEG
ncbi:peptide chain release factor 1 [Ponticaulis sp.]|jgi:peptide chain release factor 1|uniref:peptide chain release factor 1 n=1 Tax=Ponticaulis sp. TaxID=2020902 RepID=UPI000C49B5FB|nr:peptide chain release factor 1 [Ponticaulis sp.]MAJ10060.1 peptide chain release factor 1 [Ponticaulis sp.]MBN03646.1 peptide chain release factor 1 [Ponticaulis sp.]MDF1680542.1 peptide chain release factor 1 [Ponticaulis sp.]HBH88339.1 peptide chain release factor 1 [Hyphomonadaceae bacterium]|tara:strand:- start:33806 stop:34882 length:1077 start_codon:yes stop_codon:yes gene_type:complete